MSNYCNYILKVKGNLENCKKFKAKLEDYDEENHFGGIYEVIVDEEGFDFLVISGGCAWSIDGCCRANENGYSETVDLFAVNTADLDLDLEVWSREEEGNYFEEHYIYHKGECTTDESRDIYIHFSPIGKKRIMKPLKSIWTLRDQNMLVATLPKKISMKMVSTLAIGMRAVLKIGVHLKYKVSLVTKRVEKSTLFFCATGQNKAITQQGNIHSECLISLWANIFRFFQKNTCNAPTDMVRCT